MITSRPLTLEQKQTLAKDNLRCLLAALGIKSANVYEHPGMTAAFGKPDQMFIGAADFKALSEILGKK